MQYCPSCGEATLLVDETPARLYKCGQCEFNLYQNVAAAVMVAVCCGDEILIAIRARNPGLGMWDLPGGFVDPDESLEEAVVRELHEELNLVVSEPSYISSNANTYPYKNIVYKTCDTFFLVELEEKPEITAQDDVAAVQWVPLNQVEPEKFAFESAKKAFLLLKKRKGLTTWE